MLELAMTIDSKSRVTLRRLALGILGAMVFLAWTGPGCTNVEKAKPKPAATRVENEGFDLNVPQIMRGTVGSEGVLQGYQPVLVRGYGLVVDLHGNGARGLPSDLRAHMIAMASRYKVGSPSQGEQWAAISPEQLLDSLDTAVVIVEGLIPPGANKGTRFDVRVNPHPSTSPVSLEGGKLWQAELFPIDSRSPLPPTGSRSAQGLAYASGPVFINPFAEPGAIERDSIDRTSGRVLNGGVVDEDMPMKFVLANPSHRRARSLQGVINSQFSQERSQRDPTARGESDSRIEITVPPSFADEPERFASLLRATPLVQGMPEQTAMNIKRLLISDPSISSEASLRWQTLGPRALPVIREMYTYPEEQPRFAALEAGARMSDASTVPHLLELAKDGSTTVRRDAITLLTQMDHNPRIDQGLHGLLDDENVDIRLAAYEGLIERRDPFIERVVVGDKFCVDVVESSKPLIYITQIGQPRIALFGTDLSIERPVTVMAWSDRLMVKGAAGQDYVEVYYREDDATKGVISKVDPELKKFVPFLGRKTSSDLPSAGLDLSYSQTVGALHQMWSQRSIKADFKAEQDRLLAAILDNERASTVPDRPEFGGVTEPEQPASFGPAPGPLDEKPEPDSGLLPSAGPLTSRPVEPAPAGGAAK